jgi:flavin reductase (DIM6/NTAB) family NADH-FMN oxidoreductase RutF
MAIHHVVFGLVVGVHIDDDAISEDGIFEVGRVKPIARLGYKDYSWVDETNIFEMEKRTPEDHIRVPPKPAE